MLPGCASHPGSCCRPAHRRWGPLSTRCVEQALPNCWCRRGCGLSAARMVRAPTGVKSEAEDAPAMPRGRLKGHCLHCLSGRLRMLFRPPVAWWWESPHRCRGPWMCCPVSSGLSNFIRFVAHRAQRSRFFAAATRQASSASANPCPAKFPICSMFVTQSVMVSPIFSDCSMRFQTGLYTFYKEILRQSQRP